MTQLFTEYEQLLGHYCQTRDGQTYLRLVRDVMPALTMSQEEQECASVYRRLRPGELTPFKEPRNLRYEEWKRTNCWRWYYFDHERDAEQTLRQRLDEDPECRVSRVPTMAETFRIDHETPPGERPPTMKWSGYAPPPLLGVEEEKRNIFGLTKGQTVAFFAVFTGVGAWGAAAVGVGPFKGNPSAALLVGAVGGGLTGLLGWYLVEH